ncbi:MAG: hypothetical protein M3R51_10250 [Candidatus Eremiobacteraeota bacterium]|nr:hypothetical protein [Candidatus Eremiobacteraeota bacterium]
MIDASYNVHAERSAGWAAFAYVLVVLVAGLLAGVPPGINASPTDIAAWAATHQTALLVSAWLSFPGLAFFLWYVVGLRAHLIEAPGANEGLGTYFMIAGVLAAAFALLNAFFQAVLGYRGAELDAGAARLLYDAFALSGTLLFAPLSIYTLAVSYSASRHGSFPAFFSWMGYLAAALLAIATLSLFFKDGPLRPNAGFSIGVLAFYGIWTVWTGIALVRTKAGASRENRSEVGARK